MSGGVRAALDQAMEGEAGMGEIVQAGLFEELEAEETGALDAPSPLSAALPSAGRKPGRPKGAKNRRTEAVTAWLLGQHRHPLSVMMEAYSMSPVELAERLGLSRALAEVKTEYVREDGKKVTETRFVETDRFSNDVLLDLAKLQFRMAEAVAPYVAAKMPQAVQLDGQAQLTVNFGGVALSGGVSSPARGEAGGGEDVQIGEGMSVRLGGSRTP